MSTELTRIIESLLLPPGGLILLGLLGLIFFRKHLGKAFIFLSLSGFYMLSTAVVSDQLMSGLEIYPALSIEEAKKSGAQAIVVLGAGRYIGAPEYSEDTVSTLHLARLRYAAWLSRRTGLPVIPSGGAPIVEGAPEAWLARKTLTEEFNVKVAAIEDVSRNTRENAQLTKVVLDQLGFDQILLVTHAWHMSRAMYVMTNAGVNALPAPTAFRHKDGEEKKFRDWLPSASSFLYSRYAIHEYIGKLWYQITAAAK
ncbi:YdcF family protein [Pseudomonadota bacterium]